MHRTSRDCGGLQFRLANTVNGRTAGAPLCTGSQWPQKLGACNSAKTALAYSGRPRFPARVILRIALSTGPLLDRTGGNRKRSDPTALVNETRVTILTADTFPRVIPAPARVIAYTSFAGLFDARSLTEVTGHSDLD